MTNPLVTALPSSGTGSYSDAREGLATAFAMVLKDSTAVTAFNALNLATDGTPFEAVTYNGSIYDYDPTDTTTAHDPGGGCIVDASGRRYLRSAAIKPDWIVLDKDLATPPGSPSAGDAYYVATSGTGAWSGHDGDYAIYGARGWTFREVDEGHILYVADEGCYYHMLSGGTLTKGLGDLAIGDDSIEARHLAFPMGLVVQAAQTTPPGSPTDRVCYIVTATATGDWAGEEGHIAEYDDDASAWVFHTPRTGDVVWDVAAGYLKNWSGSAWVRATQSPIILQWFYGEFDGTAYSIDFNTEVGATAVTNCTWTMTGGSTSNDIVATVIIRTASIATVSVGLFVDSETTARAKRTLTTDNAVVTHLKFDVPDTSSHDITVKVWASGGTVQPGCSVIMEERTV